MCNKYGYNSPLHRMIEKFRQVDLPFDRPPLLNIPAREEINPTDPAPIARRGEAAVELTQMRWGFPPPRPRAGPVINFRSEDRTFTTGRCLIPATHFFEFTGAKYPRTRWQFTMPGEDFFCIAGIYRCAGEEARFTMLTVAPGPDVAPYHDRQIVPLAAAAWSAWLDPLVPSSELLAAGPAGMLAVEMVG
jgi:putative SOS response-associated peptidase YedK